MVDDVENAPTPRHPRRALERVPLGGLRGEEWLALVFAGGIVCLLIAGFVLGPLLRWVSIDSRLMAALPFLLFVGLAMLCLRIRPRELGIQLPTLKRVATLLGYTVVLMVFQVSVFSLVLGILSHHSVDMANSILFMMPNRQLATGVTVQSFFVFFLAVAVVGPIVEEVIFRGLLFQGLWATWSPVAAIATSSVLFGFAHGSLGFAQIIAGVCFAVAYIERRSIVDCILMHCFNNGLVSVVLFSGLIVRGHIEERSALLAEPIPVWSLAASAIVAALTAVVLWRWLRSVWRREVAQESVPLAT